MHVSERCELSKRLGASKTNTQWSTIQYAMQCNAMRCRPILHCAAHCIGHIGPIQPHMLGALHNCACVRCPNSQQATLSTRISCPMCSSKPRPTTPIQAPACQALPRPKHHPHRKECQWDCRGPGPSLTRALQASHQNHAKTHSALLFY